jgi:hypothetical protein
MGLFDGCVWVDWLARYYYAHAQAEDASETGAVNRLRYTTMLMHSVTRVGAVNRVGAVIRVGAVTRVQ